MPLDFSQFLNRPELSHWRSSFTEILLKQVFQKKHGHMTDWLNVVANLPDIKADKNIIDQDTVHINSKNPLNEQQSKALLCGLKKLMPWRKGPYQFFDTFIDTEWRSDWKWQRLAPHISSLTGKNVLDVGCGSGYHCWRMLGEGAEYVLGIDPTLRFYMQYLAAQKYIQSTQFDFLPIGIEHLPTAMEFFDTSFSMGVLYHRRDMQQHIIELRDTLKVGGELVLETLIVDEDYPKLKNGVLVPEDRYAAMRNVWNIPTIKRLESELKLAGFNNIRCIEENTTSLEEQRRTEWIAGYSLYEFLDPEDITKTREGYPAPKRATMVAIK